MRASALRTRAGRLGVRPGWRVSSDAANETRPTSASPTTPQAVPLSRTERASRVIERLREHIPRPETELQYTNPFELLVAVILSAQCTDARVNMVTPALLEAFPTAAAMAAAEPEDLFPFIRSVSYPNNKAKALATMARQLVENHGGDVPGTHDALMKLRGVGRKTANVIVAVAFDEPAIAVDTHVFRVANRIGLVSDAKTPRAVENGLRRVIPREEWGDAHHLLILHGRYTCQARKPHCERCPITDLCQYYAQLQQLPAPLAGLDASRGTYFCKTHRGYFDQPALKTDRSGTEQLACPRCGSMNVFAAKSGETARRVKDYRVG
jgi:endonuclease III